jgi:hypothetical protein
MLIQGQLFQFQSCINLFFVCGCLGNTHMLYLHKYFVILYTYITQLYVSKVIFALLAMLVGHTKDFLVLNLSTWRNMFHTDILILVLLIAAQLTIQTLN